MPSWQIGIASGLRLGKPWMLGHPSPQCVPSGQGEEVILADAVGRSRIAPSQDDEAELVGQAVDGGLVEAGQGDAWLVVVFDDSPAYSGDLERPIRSIVNTQSGDPEHAPDLA